MDNGAKPTILLLVERWEVPAAESGVSFPLLSTLGGPFFFFVSCTALRTACLLHFIPAIYILNTDFLTSDTQQYVWPDNKELKLTFFLLFSHDGAIISGNNK